MNYPHPDLAGILDATEGIIIYQEQILLICQLIAGYSLKDADILRRAISKKNSELMADSRELFIKKSVARGVELSVAEGIFTLIARFANYGFNKSHAIAYSIIAYQLSYLKANYPIEYFAVVLQSGLLGDKKIAYLNEVQSHGFTVLQPSILKSDLFLSKEENSLRLGFALISGFGEVNARNLMENRSKNNDFFEFINETFATYKPGPSVISNLIDAGCFDDFYVLAKPLNRHQLHTQLPILIKTAPYIFSFGKPSIKEITEYDFPELCKMEKNALGFNVKYNLIDYTFKKHGPIADTEK